MITKGRNGAQITDRDLRRVMAARRALHAYEPYAPTVRPRATTGGTRARTRSATAAPSTAQARSSAR